MFPYFLCFYWLCADVCTLKGTITSSSPFGLASVGNYFHLQVIARAMLIGLQSPILGRAQLYGLHALPSPVVKISKDGGGLY